MKPNLNYLDNLRVNDLKINLSQEIPLIPTVWYLKRDQAAINDITPKVGKKMIAWHKERRDGYLFAVWSIRGRTIRVLGLFTYAEHLRVNIRNIKF